MRFESPIEFRLAYALSTYPLFGGKGLWFNTQVDLWCGYRKYRGDMVVYRGNRALCVVECDGAQFHTDRVRDAQRSRDIYRCYRLHTVRFSGRAIYNEPYVCTDALYNFIMYGVNIPQRLSSVSYF